MLGEHPDLWDFVLGSWEDDSVTSRFGPEAEQEPYVRGLKQLTSKPVVGRRPLHLPRHDGAPDQERGARSHRRRTAFDRRPVPAQEDRDRSPRGHPRVHRLQHLRLRRLHDVPDPLHAEPDDGRGVPSRLASREESSPGSPATPTVLVVGAGPAGLEAARSLGNRGYTVSLAEASRALGGRVAREVQAARPVGLDPRRRLPRATDPQARQRRSLHAERDDRRRHHRQRLQPRRRRHRCSLAPRRCRPLAHPAHGDRRGRRGSQPRRHHGRCPPARVSES